MSSALIRESSGKEVKDANIDKSVAAENFAIKGSTLKTKDS